MTETDRVLNLVLEGQKELSSEVKGMRTDVTKLQVEVKHLREGRAEGQADHDKCRGEINGVLDDHETRIVSLEDERRERRGISKGQALLWKIIAGVLSTGYLVLSAIAIFHNWGG